MTRSKAPSLVMLASMALGTGGAMPLGAAPLLAQAAAPSAERLDQLTAKVALYPDALLAQILLCAADAGRVVQLSVWLKENANLKGSELQDAAQKAGFEASYVALAPFPQVVTMMAEDTKWTGELGRAFASDRNAVFDSIQRLRGKSQAIGNLKSTPQQTVESKTTESGQQVIVIEPANPQVVYVPQYNPTVVYTQPATTTTVVVHEDDDDEVVAGLIGFTAGIAIGAAINNNYYYGPYGWRGGGYMYSGGWNNYYEDREDAREDFYDNRDDARDDWADHREDMAGERSERAENAREQGTNRQQNAQEQRTQRQEQRGSSESQAQRDQRRSDAQAQAQSRRSGGEGAASASATQASTGGERQARSGQAATQARSGEPRSGSAASTYESRGKSGERSGAAAAERSGTRSDAFSNYSSGRSTRSESSRGQRSRSSSSGGSGRSRRR